MANKRKLILFTDIGDTIIDEGSELRDVPGGVVRRADCLPGARAAMLDIFAAGFPIAMVADGLVESFDNTMRLHGLEHIFAARAISEAVGAEKPSPRIFAEAMRQLGLGEADKPRIVMVGNNLARDVAGANRFGIRSVLLAWSPRYRHEPERPEEVPGFRIDSPAELPELLERLDRTL